VIDSGSRRRSAQRPPAWRRGPQRLQALDRDPRTRSMSDNTRRHANASTAEHRHHTWSLRSVVNSNSSYLTQPALTQSRKPRLACSSRRQARMVRRVLSGSRFASRSCYASHRCRSAPTRPRRGICWYAARPRHESLAHRAASARSTQPATHPVRD